MDNSTPMIAKEYDQKIEKTIPFFSEFYRQTIDLVKVLPAKKGVWLDTGCGTGEFVSQALTAFDQFQFILCDPSNAMIAKAQAKLGLSSQIADFCVCGSQQLNYSGEIDIITAIQSHHYMSYEDRVTSIKNCYDALTEHGVFIFFENYAPGSQDAKHIVLERWGRYQKEHGKTDSEVAEHLARYGKNYFPITLSEHFKLLSDSGFNTMEIFWLSYMQVGIYAIK